ncbi:MAG TPA: heteromeric transposase endonuclease subunit TnsA, partial [Idiomarina sp.]|nr:heteromeric transposase endonuclease subunit TnsA [Idiomarina sp.]
MASHNKRSTEALFARWIKEGRGSGQHADYKPWLTVRDLPSLGRVHRVFGHKSRRTHHLLSDLELSVFLLLEWHSEITQVREQFPL